MKTLLTTSRPGWLGLVPITLWLAIAPADGQQTYTFIPQNGNYSWFSVSNWFTGPPLAPANTLPGPGDNAIIFAAQAVNAAANQIHLNSLTLENTSAVNNGDFYVSTVVMDPGSGFNGSVVNVNTEMDVTGACGLTGATLTVGAGATMFLNPGASLSCGTSTIFNVGEINLANGSGLSSGTNLVNQGIIDGTTNSYVSGSGTFDNQGKVQCDSGTLNVGPFNTWTSTTGTGRFKTTATNAVMNFPSGLTIPTNITFIFSGPGLIKWPSGAVVAGVAQVGIIVTNTTLLDAGLLEMDSYVSSNGVIHVVATPLAGSVVNCVSGAVGPVLNGPTLNIDTNAQLNILGGLTVQNSVVNNAGTVTWKKADFYLPGGVFNNLAGALFDCEITNNSSVDGYVGALFNAGGIFNNAGTFRKSIGTRGIVFYESGLGPLFNNSGTVDVRSGYVQFAGGTNNGIYTETIGAEVWFGGGPGRTNILQTGVQFIGTNFVRVVQFANLFLAGDVTLANLSLQDSAVIDGPGGLTATNTLALNSGIMQGAGTVTIPVGAILVVSNGTPVIRQRVVNNSGTILVSTGGALLEAGAVINNLAVGVINCVTNNGIGYDISWPPMGTLNNFGNFIRSAGAGTISLWLNFTNYNLVQFLTGSVAPYNYQQISGSTVIASNVTVSSSSSPQQFAFLGGTFSGLGNVSGGMSNAAVVIPASPPGTLTIGTYNQNPAGTLTILIADTNQYSQLKSPGSPTIAGTLNVVFTNGFTPAVGQQFYVVEGNYPVAGTFTNFTGMHFNGMVLVPIYNYYSVELTAANDPTVTDVTRNGQKATFSYLSTAGFTNIIQYTLSLSPPHWLTLTNVPGDGTVKTITDPNATNATRFYRISF